MEVDDEQNQTLEQQQQNSNDNTLQNPNSPLSSDSSDSDDDSQQTLQLNALQTELSNNPSNYDAHVQYIKLLRKMGEIEKLREAREAMSVVFPLTPQMWQDWAKDEASLSTRPEEFCAVEKLYEQGVFDYLSVPLWFDYLNYIQENDPSVRECSPDGISKARNLFERALAAGGLHFTEGSKIWEAYREFEQAILLTIDVTDAKGKESEVHRIRTIFHRQLSVPLDDLKSTLLAYKAWEVEQGNNLDAESSDDGLPSHVASAYKKAMEMYDARVCYEEQISRQDISDTEKFQNFMTYLKFEKSAGDPVRIQVFYERAITEFPVSSDLWLDYVHYLDRTLKVGKVLKDVYSRAIKNCSWVGEIWVRYLLSLERSRDSEEAISAVFEKSLQCTFLSFDEYLDLFLTRIDGLRRRVLFGNEAEGVLDYACIRKTFQHASDYLCPHLKATEELLHLHAYWARLELNLGKDLAAARGVWESFLKNSGSMLEAWRQYIEMEIQLGNITEARSIYRRCYSRRFAETGSEDICHSWLRFEREFGTLEDFDRAVQKVSPRLEELKLYRIQEESKALAGSADQKENPSKKNVREKRKGGTVVGVEQSPAKRQKQTPQIPKKIHAKDKDPAQNLAEVNEAEEVREKTEKESSTDGKQMKISDTGKSKIYTDQCTAFISNINLKATDEDLREFFSDVGGVVSVRILHDRFTGKSRGLAYVDFSDDEHLGAAVRKNKQMLLGKKVSVAQSDPKQHKKDGRRGHKEQEMSDQSRNSGSSRSKESGAPQNSVSATHRRDAIQLKGKNTFAIPRNVRPLGMKADKPKTAEEGDEKPKSNDEFRKMFIKS